MTITPSTPLRELPEFLTPAQVQVYLQVGRSTIYELLRTGAIPSRRFGRQIRIPREALLTAGEQSDLMAARGGKRL